MQTTQQQGDIVADPVGHISISGVHGRHELERRLAKAPSNEKTTATVGRVIAGALIGAAVMYLLDR